MAEIVPMAEGPVTLTIKMTPVRHLRFAQLAREYGKSPNVLAQLVIDLYMDECDETDAARQAPNANLGP
jgi:hypothetical protein